MPEREEVEFEKTPRWTTILSTVCFLACSALMGLHMDWNMIGGVAVFGVLAGTFLGFSVCPCNIARRASTNKDSQHGK